MALGTQNAPLGALSVPGAQAPHTKGEAAAMVGLKYPRGQGRHEEGEEAPSATEYVPAMHALQVVALGGAQYPTAQHTPAPAPEPVLRAQGRQAEEEVAEGKAL